MLCRGGQARTAPRAISATPTARTNNARRRYGSMSGPGPWRHVDADVDGARVRDAFGTVGALMLATVLG